MHLNVRKRTRAAGCLAAISLFLLYSNPSFASEGHAGDKGHGHPDVTKKVVDAIVEMNHHLGESYVEWNHLSAELRKIRGEIKDIEAHAKVELLESIDASLQEGDQASFSHNLLRVCYYMMVDKLHQAEDHLDDFKEARGHFQNAALAYKPISLTLSKSDPQTDKDVKEAFRNAAKALGNPRQPGSADKARFKQEKGRIEAYLDAFSTAQ